MITDPQSCRCSLKLLRAARGLIVGVPLLSVQRCMTALAVVIVNGCTVPLVPFASLPVEGIVLDETSEDPLSGATVLVRALTLGGSELGRQSGGVLKDGEFGIGVPIPAESPRTRKLEVTVSRDDCETIYLFDVDEDITLVDQGGLFRSFSFRITDPILVPACAEDGDGRP